MEVEIWSDIVCPWCYVGKRRFEAALAAFEHRDEVRVSWRAFELDPSAPRERSVDGATHLAEKYGTTRAQAAAMQQRMTVAAAADGLNFRFDIARAGNSFDAHRIVQLASTHELQDPVEERLLRAYLTEGEAIGDPATLERLALETGLPADDVRQVLTTDRFGEEVRDDEATATSLGISAVPFFVIDRSFGASGAQPPEVLGELLRRAWEARAPLSLVADGAACGANGC